MVGYVFFYISGTGTFELQVVAQDPDSFSRFALGSLIHLLNVKNIHTRFSLGEVKANSALPQGHLGPRAGTSPPVAPRNKTADAKR